MANQRLVNWATRSLALSMSVLVAAPSSAQTNIAIEEIIVSARKRNESLLDVPVAVTALSARDIKVRAIQDLEGVTQFTPGFSLTTNGASRNTRFFQTLLIRGMLPSIGSVASTSLFIDGAPVQLGFVEGLSAVERVEVIKGPQSAYFGRASFAGAVNLITASPGNEWAGSVDVLYGSDNWSDVRVTVEGPIVEDKLAFRLTGRGYSTDGQYTNSWNGSRMGDESTKSISGTLSATPTDNLSIKAFAVYWKDRDGSAANGKFRGIDYNCNSGVAPAGTNNYICGTLPDFPEERIGLNVPVDGLFRGDILGNANGLFDPIFSPPFNDEPGLERRAWHANLAIDYELENSGITLSSLTGRNSDDAQDIINSINEDVSDISNPLFGIVPGVLPYPSFFFLVERRARDFSQEFRATSDQDNRFRWLIGGNYNRTSASGYVYGIASFGQRPFGAPNTTRTRTSGVFGSVAYDVTDSLTLNLEGRYQEDRVRVDSRLTGETSVSTKYKSFSPRAILEFRPTDDLMVYATFARGNNPGTFNTFLLTQPQDVVDFVVAQTGAGISVDEERLDNFELGAKGKFWDGRGQFTVAAYYAKWKDQVTSDFVLIDLPGGGVNIIRPLSNIGQTDLKGIEIEGTVQLTDQITVNAGFGYNESDIKVFNCVICETTITGSSDVKGNQLSRVPKYNGAIGVNYNDNLSGDLDWFARGDLVFRDGMYATEANLAKTKKSERFNFRVGVETDVWRIEAFVVNAFNDDAQTSIERSTDLGRLGSGDQSFIVGLPVKRQFGVRFNYDL